MSVALDLRKQLDDPATRIEALIETFDRRIQRQFLGMVSNIKDEIVLREVEELLTGGRVDEALSVADKHIQAFADKANEAYITGGRAAAAIISGETLVTFDLTNFRATEAMRRNQLNLIREFSQDQREATRLALATGTAQGLNPRDQARLFRDSIGLTARQQQAVLNYEQLLRSQDAQALTRKLRDARFDSSVRAALQSGKPLTEDQIARMVSRYRDRSLKNRAETIARTEALSAVHEGNDEMYRQAVDSGALDPEEIERTWITAKDSRVRDEHNGMNNQTVVGVDEPFISDNGVRLRYPGDRNAPANERIQCRCAVATRLVDPDDEETMASRQLSEEQKRKKQERARLRREEKKRQQQQTPIIPKKKVTAKKKTSTKQKLTDEEKKAAKRERARLRREKRKAEQQGKPVPPPTTPTPPASAAPQLQQATPKTFVPAKKMADVESRMNAIGGGKITDNAGMVGVFQKAAKFSHSSDPLSMKMANFYLRASEDFLTRFPKLRGKMPLMLLRRFPNGSVMGRAQVPYSTSALPRNMRMHVRPEWNRPASFVNNQLNYVKQYGGPHNALGTRGEGFGYVVWRHELGHTLSTPSILDRWRKAAQGLSLEWRKKYISYYASTNQKEMVAEAFAMYTDAEYVAGTLPAQLERILQDMVEGRLD
jgi:hypothetical protein